MSRDLGQTSPSRCFGECERERLQAEIADLEYWRDLYSKGNNVKRERIEWLEAQNNWMREDWETLFKILDTVEVNENGKEFHPTTIRSCRVAHTEKLRELFAEVRDCLKENSNEG